MSAQRHILDLPSTDAAAGTTMSSSEQGEAQRQPRRASERRSSLQQIEALKVRRASERRASVALGHWQSREERILRFFDEADYGRTNANF